MKKMKFSISKEECIGCGSCEAVCPEVFKMKEDKAELKVKESDKQNAKEAAESCPTNAIKIK